jgi:Methyltransferase domain
MEVPVLEKIGHSARRANALAGQLGARRYLEIGVSTGQTFRGVKIAERTGVDPAFRFDVSEVTDEFTRLVPSTSDLFFANEPLFPSYDVVFIDGLHTFEQVVRDLSNVMLRTHRRSVIILDDTLPNDVYSAIPNVAATMRHRKAAGNNDTAWHGDVFKSVFYIHDFWPSLNYRTVVGSGNPQTIVWRSPNGHRAPLFNNLETISRLSYFDLQEHMEVLRRSSEDEAISLCVAEIVGL